jgi:hypothetical protein
MTKLANGILGLVVAVFSQTLFLALLPVGAYERTTLIYSTVIVMGASVFCNLTPAGQINEVRTIDLIAIGAVVNVSVLVGVITRSPGLWVLGSTLAALVVIFPGYLISAIEDSKSQVPPIVVPPEIPAPPTPISQADRDFV